jgi:hypothetical protein
MAQIDGGAFPPAVFDDFWRHDCEGGQVAVLQPGSPGHGA